MTDITDNFDLASELSAIAMNTVMSDDPNLHGEFQMAFLAVLTPFVAENQRLRLALRIIAGYEQCIDNLLSNADIARAALNPEGEATSGSSKWGPQFPPASCTAYEDCAHDGVCHDPNCGAPAQHGKGGEGEA